jgi:hypothetical protein
MEASPQQLLASISMLMTIRQPAVLIASDAGGLVDAQTSNVSANGLILSNVTNRITLALFANLSRGSKQSPETLCKRCSGFADASIPLRFPEEAAIDAIAGAAVQKRQHFR